MQNDMERMTEPKQLLQWMGAHDVLIGLSALDAALLFGYLEGHDYGLAVTKAGELVRVDLSSEQPEAEPYSVDDLIDQVCEWNYEMILDADMKRNHAERAADFMEDQKSYEAYMLDGWRLDKMFDKTKYASQTERIAKKLAEQVVREMTIHPEKAAEVIAAGMKKYEEMKVR